MSVLGIRARFPRGVYRGHSSSGEYDPLPSPLRLHAALVAAAGDGSTALAGGDGLRRSEDATRALEWLQNNAPEYVELPDVAQNGRTADRTFAYRDEGVVENVAKSPTRRKTPRTVGDTTALRGPLGWGWEHVPEDVARTLDDLCADVPCLGEADSPVVLEVGQIVPTHRRSTSRSPFASVAVKLAVARPGRLEELDRRYEDEKPRKTPTVAADRWKATEQPSPSPIPQESHLVLGYDALDEPTEAVQGPWERVVIYPVSKSIPMSEHVAWSVTMHKALVAALDDDATPMVTGRYEKGAAAPANRVAIQILSSDVMAMSTHSGVEGGVAVLVPEGAFDAIAPVLHAIRRLYRGGAGALNLGKPVVMAAADFWRAPADGTVRTWAAVPAVVPETRRQKPTGDRRWTLADSALLSVGFVYRDQLSIVVEGTAGQRYSAIIDAVETLGVRVLNTSPIPDADISKYAHKLPQGVVGQPYRLSLTGGRLMGETTLVAVGQSRHLGGGLLVPLDLPKAIASAWGAVE